MASGKRAKSSAKGKAPARKVVTRKDATSKATARKKSSKARAKRNKGRRAAKAAGKSLGAVSFLKNPALSYFARTFDSLL